jgi:S1-C subfamily serine protease
VSFPIPHLRFRDPEESNFVCDARAWLAGMMLVSAFADSPIHKMRTSRDVKSATSLSAMHPPAHGGSGGPVFNARGSVIGVNSSYVNSTYMGGSSGALGCGYTFLEPAEVRR